MLSFEDVALRLVAAPLLGAAVGIERQYRQRAAGLRTNALVALGAAAVGVACGTGFLNLAALAAALIIAVNIAIRPLVALIDRAPAAGAEAERTFRIGLRRLPRFLTAWLVATAFLLSIPAAALADIDAGMPNPPGSPTVVKVGIFLADLIDLDEVNETFQAEFIIKAEWEDPRLAFDPAVAGTDMKLFQGQFQFNEVFSGWWPQLVIINEIGSGDVNAITIEVHSDGRIRYLEQRNVTLETPMQLHAFPFDVQTLEAKMIAFGNYSGEVLLEVDERVLGATEEHVAGTDRVNIAEWRLVSLDMVSKLSDYRYYGEPKQLSEIRFTTTLERRPSNMIWKVIFPLIVLVLLMSAVFWMEEDNLSDRLNVAFIGILTIVAYQFVIDGTMPRIAYFTFLDTVLLYSFLVMCLSIFESLLLHSMCKAGRREAAERVDRFAKWAFPPVYFLGLVVSYLYYVGRG